MKEPAGPSSLRKSETDGVGAIGREGKLVDAAHMRLAENVLYEASLAAAGADVDRRS